MLVSFFFHTAHLLIKQACLQGAERLRKWKQLLLMFSAQGSRRLCSPYEQWCLLNVLPCREKAEGGMTWFVPSLSSTRWRLWRRSTVLQLVLLMQDLEEEVTFGNIYKPLNMVINRWNVADSTLSNTPASTIVDTWASVFWKSGNSLLAFWSLTFQTQTQNLPVMRHLVI